MVDLIEVADKKVDEIQETKIVLAISKAFEMYGGIENVEPMDKQGFSQSVKGNRLFFTYCTDFGIVNGASIPL